MNKITERYVYTNCSSQVNPGKAGANVLICGATGPILKKSFYLGTTTSNLAEYTAQVPGLKEEKKLCGAALSFHSDPELLVQEISKSYRVKDETLNVLFFQVKTFLSLFLRYEINYISRDQNKEADPLANDALDQAPVVHCSATLRHQS
jgi:ribonuclease HI